MTQRSRPSSELFPRSARRARLRGALACALIVPMLAMARPDAAPVRQGATLSALPAAQWLISDEGRKALAARLNARHVHVQRLFVEQLPVVQDQPADAPASARRINLDLDGEAHTLLLEPHSVRADDFRILVDLGDALLRPWDEAARIDPRLQNAQPPAPSTYRGAIDGLIASEAAASLVPAAQSSDGRERLRSAALRLPDGSITRIQPVSDLYPGADPDLYVLYRDQDLIDSHEHTCGVDHSHQAHADAHHDADTPTFSERGPACNKIAEVVIDTDFEYTSSFAGQINPAAACTGDIEGIINEMDFAVQRDIDVSTKINAIVLRLDINDPYTDATAHGTLLAEHRALWLGISLATQPRDYAHLFTGRDLDGGTIGVAYVGVICNFDFGVGLSQVNFTTTQARRVLLVAHEMGHQWNAPHDNQTGSACADTPNGFIMNPSLGTQALQYSDCSITRMSTYRDSTSASCVTTPSGPPITKPDQAFVALSQTANIDVLRNDVSNCGPMVLSLPSTTTAAGGTLAIFVGLGPNGRNIVRWNPPSSPSPWFGTDTFSYTATNDIGPSTQTVTVNVAPPRPAETPTGTVPGVNVRYYALDTTPSTMPDYAALAPYAAASVNSINYATTTGNFATSGRADNVGAVFKGFVNVPATGAFTFFTNSDDGSKLFIGDQLVVNNDGVHGAQERSGVIALAAGKHALRVEFFEGTGSTSLNASYQGPGVSKQNIPNSALSRFPLCPADFDFNETIDVVDLFAFLDAWFAQVGQSGAGLSADRNNNLVVDVVDLFLFLDQWFASCP